MLGKISSYPTYPIAVILKMAMHLEDPERTGCSGVERGAWSVRRENSGQGDGGDHPRFPGTKNWVAHSALSDDLWAGWGQNAPKRGRKGGFFKVYHVDHIGATPLSVSS